jgi:alkanesulfonate monooxygenase SsuD/methylene tetrahydromethanopterin reductase-like flavin-dependent oxidoreductase (luciferase family)
VKLGLQIPSFTWPGGDAAIGPTLARIAETADGVGFDSLWVMDHFYQIRGTLGLMVGGVHYRQAGLWAKAATTLDVLSGGRAYLGIGAAWNEEESHGLGFPMPPLGVRFEMLEETLQIVHAMWQGERGSGESFRGKHYQADRLLNSPQALSKPHPRILIGGGGEQKTLRLVARYADACNVFGGPDQLSHKFSVLRERCAEVGRPFGEIERTNLGRVDLATQSASEVVAGFGRLADVGVQHVIFSLAGVADVHNIEALGRDVIPQVHAIEPKPI